MTTTDVWRWSAREIARAVREREVSCREVVVAHLDRIRSVNPSLNAVTVTLEEEAVRAAEGADRVLAEGGPVGPLHGVPLTVKENIDLAGTATTQGLVALAGAEPAVDAPQVERLRSGGAIPIGRTNLPDVGLRWHTDSALRGPTRNPWDPSRTPGGSSGGDAVAVATGMAPIGLGNDYGGSLRFPAQCCGVTAIRPTMGRVPQAASLAPFDQPMITSQLFSVQGPLARRVGDLRAALLAMAGPDSRDPWWTPAPLEGHSRAGPIRVAFTADPAGGGTDAEVARGVRRAAEALANAGYTVEEVEPPCVEQASRLYTDLVLTEIRNVILPVVRPLASPHAVRFLDLLLDHYPALDIAAYMRGFAARLTIAREWARFLDRHPLVLGPVCTLPAFDVDWDVASGETAVATVRAMRLTVTVNLLGLPSVAVPVGVAGGLPRGVQIIGPRYREDLCLDAAEAVERELGVLAPVDPVVSRDAGGAAAGR